MKRIVKTAVITGAAGGLGKALSIEAAARGYAVAMTDIGPLDDLDAALDVPTLCHKFDVSSARQMQEFSDAVFERFGRVDLLFNNAGIFNTGSVLDGNPESWSRIMDVNFFGTLHAIQSFVPRMINTGQPGHVVNIASISGLYVSPMVGAYSVSKHAVTALSETLLFELQRDHHPIQVSVVCPGAIKTEILNPDRHGEELDRSAEAQNYLSRMRDAMAGNGVEPEILAKQIFDEVSDGKFWIIPNRDLLGPLQIRTDSINDGTTPQFKMTRTRRAADDQADS